MKEESRWVQGFAEGKKWADNKLNIENKQLLEICVYLLDGETFVDMNRIEATMLIKKTQVKHKKGEE
jgi:hypothetical protein